MLDVIVDGEMVDPAAATVSVFDSAVQRGVGCFEAMHAYDGVIFRAGAHLDRLAASASALDIELPARDLLETWTATQAAVGCKHFESGEAAVRIFVTGGTGSFGLGGPRTIVTVEAAPDLAETMRVLPVVAPWHAAGVSSQLTGAKTVSYAPNMAARRVAEEAGFDDALLISRDRIVLEGPTYAVAWMSGGDLFTPSLDLGILDSITRAAVIELAEMSDIDVAEGRFTLDAVMEADEVMVMSTFREITPVIQIDDRALEAGPATARLIDRFRAMIASERR